MMQKRLKWLSIIILIALLIVVGFEYYLRSIPNDYKTKANYLKENGSEIETLVLGSSHTFYGVNPNLLPNAYNLAHSSKSYDLDWKILETYQDYLPNLKTIILSSSYFSYVHTVGNSTQKQLLKNYSLYYKIPIENGALNLYSELFSLPLNENLARVKKSFKNLNYLITIDNKGFIEKRKSVNVKVYESPETVKKHTQKLDSLQLSENINGLKNIITFAKRKQIKIILITTPVAPNYYKNMNDLQFEHWQKTTKDLIKNDSNIIWIDLFQAKNFNQNDFVDSDHLSLQGANKVTKEIKKYIE